MTARLFLYDLVYVAGVTVIALTAVLLASLAMHSTPVSVSTGCTAAWLALTLLPCPCHKRGQR